MPFVLGRANPDCYARKCNGDCDDACRVYRMVLALAANKKKSDVRAAFEAAKESWTEAQGEMLEAFNHHVATGEAVVEATQKLEECRTVAAYARDEYNDSVTQLQEAFNAFAAAKDALSELEQLSE